MGNREYWKNREEKARQNRIRDEEAYNRELRKIYAYMTDIASKEIAGFYSKYAKAEGITLAEAKQRLSAADIAEYARKAEQYVPDKDFSDKANEEMRLYNAMMSINRLEMLKSSIGLGMVEGFDKMDKSMREGLTQAAIKEFERQAGILGQTVIAPLEAAQAIVDSSFHNATFSERIWLHQDMLRSELEKVLTEGLIMGVNSRVLARHISKVFGASQKDAERLMRTEISRVCTEAQKLSYERNGYEQYEIVCEPTACDQCMPLNGEHYFTKDMRAGDNAPPFHPNCHCTTCAYEDLEAFEKWLDYKDNGGEDGWEEWLDHNYDESDLPRNILDVVRGVRGTTRDFERGLTRLHNNSIKELFKNAYEDTKIIKNPFDRNSRYDGKKILLGTAANSSTLAHELFHVIDRKNKLTDNGLLHNSIKKDFTELQKQAKINNISVIEYLVLKYPNAFSDTTKGNERLKIEYRGISDILHGCSKEQIFLGYGHTKKNYWAGPHAVEKETFAQYGRITYENNNDVVKMFKELFPESDNEILNTIKGLV